MSLPFSNRPPLTAQSEQQRELTVDELLAKPFLHVEEAARVLRIGRGAAYEAVKCGQIPAIRVGRKLRVPTAKLLAMAGIETAK